MESYILVIYPAILVPCFHFHLIEKLFPPPLTPLLSIQHGATLIWTPALFLVASDPSYSLPFIIFLLLVCKGQADVSLFLLIFKGCAACPVSARSFSSVQVGVVTVMELNKLSILSLFPSGL